MAFIAAAAPYIAAASAVYSAASSRNASIYNAATAKNEQTSSINQAAAQEALVRRNSRQQLGKQEAAFGAANVGYGGSSETALDTSAVNQEWDALNTRYKGVFTGYGYGVQSQLDQTQANQYGVLAGMKALQGVGQNYSFAPPPPAQQAGLTPVS